LRTLRETRRHRDLSFSAQVENPQGTRIAHLENRPARSWLGRHVRANSFHLVLRHSRWHTVKMNAKADAGRTNKRSGFRKREVPSRELTPFDSFKIFPKMRNCAAQLWRIDAHLAFSDEIPFL
jgi:hypothetical protein